MHESSETAIQPKDFTQINKSLIKQSINMKKEDSNGKEKMTEKELRKKLDIRKKVKKGQKQ